MDYIICQAIENNNNINSVLYKQIINKHNPICWDKGSLFENMRILQNLNLYHLWKLSVASFSHL